MIKFLFLGRRAPGLTRAAAQAHLRDVHGRMVVLPPPGAGAMPAYGPGAAAAAVRVRGLLGTEGIDRDRSLMIVAEEYTEERLRALLG